MSVIELPWKRMSEHGYRGGVPFHYFSDQHPDYIVASGHPTGFGTCRYDPSRGGNVGYLPAWSWGRPGLFLDPREIPDSMWRDGDSFPARTQSGYHASRFVVGWCEHGLGTPYRVVPFLLCYAGTSTQSKRVWTGTSISQPVGCYRPLRWISYTDLWNSFPAAFKQANRWLLRKGEYRQAGSDAHPPAPVVDRGSYVP